MPQWTRGPSHATKAKLVTQPLARVWNTLANSSSLNLPSSLQLSPCRPSETDNHEKNEDPHIQISHKPPPVYSHPCTINRPGPTCHQRHEDLATLLRLKHVFNHWLRCTKPQPLPTCRWADRCSAQL